MRHVIKNTSLALLLLLPGDHAPAADDAPNVMTLSCDGMLTATHGANKPEALQPLQNTALVVNLDEQIFGLCRPHVPIEAVGEASIKFGGT
jgi:hypothetical protein